MDNFIFILDTRSVFKQITFLKRRTKHSDIFFIFVL